MALSHKPQVLYLASLERIAAARRALRDNDYALCMYLSGLAVECILQAVALRGGASPDAHHNLAKWLAKCPATLRESIRQNAGSDWNRVAAAWDNGIRYLSSDGLLGYLRAKGLTRGIAGGRPSILRLNANVMLNAALSVHERGANQWVNYTGK